MTGLKNLHQTLHFIFNVRHLGINTLTADAAYIGGFSFLLAH